MTADPPHDPPRIQSTWNVALAWTVIAAVVAFVAWRNFSAAHAPRMERAAGNVVLSMQARSALGAHAIFSAFPQAANPKNTAQLVQQITTAAQTPAQELCAAIMIGELQGAPAALDELDRIRPRLDSASLQADSRTLRTIYTRGVRALPPGAGARLAARLGWFGRLALTFGAPATNPARHAIVSSGIRAILASFALELLLVAAFIIGIALLTWAIVRLVDGRVCFGYKPPAHSSGFFLEAFALYLAGYVAIGALMRRFSHAPTWSIYLIDLAWVAFACLWPLIRGADFATLRRGLGWHTGRGVFREMAAGIAGYLAGMPLLALAVYVTVLLSRLSRNTPIHPIVFEAGGGLGAIIGLYLLASVWAPIVEETMFRGALFHHLRGRHRWLFSAALSALIFASLHPQGWTAIPVLAMIGFIFAGIREWRGTALASATAHALNNAVAVTLLILILH